jgi:hypothetical protein
VHRVHGHHRPGEVEVVEKLLYCGDLVALRRDRDLAEDGAGVVVVGGDQMRRDAAGPIAAIEGSE